MYSRNYWKSHRVKKYQIKSYPAYTIMAMVISTIIGKILLGVNIMWEFKLFFFIPAIITSFICFYLIEVVANYEWRWWKKRGSLRNFIISPFASVISAFVILFLLFKYGTGGF